MKLVERRTLLTIMKKRSLSRKISLVVMLFFFCFALFFIWESTRRIYVEKLDGQLTRLEAVAHEFNQELSFFLPEILEMERNGKGEAILAINTLLQPVVDAIIEGTEMGLGYYSRNLDAIVAIGPFSESKEYLGISIHGDHPSRQLYTEVPVQREVNHVLRGKVARYAKVIFWNGEPIGHIWANLPITIFYQQFFPSILFSFSFGFLGILLSVFISFYISLIINRATDSLKEGIDSLKIDTISREDFDGSLSPDLPVELQPIYSRYLQSVNHIQELNKELTISSRLAALGDLVTVVAHDIRNPLSLIMARAHLGKRGTDEEKILMIYDGILSASNLINQFLERMLLLAKVHKIQKKWFSIQNSIQDLLDLMTPFMRQEGILCSMDLEKDLPMVLGDPVGFQQAFLNLLKNALEVTAKGEMIQVKAICTKEGLLISLTDSGPGIPDDIKGDIFKRFFTTKDATGSGIGLAMAHSVVTNQGGKIWFQSTIDEGTTFFILFPSQSLSTYEKDPPILARGS